MKKVLLSLVSVVVLLTACSSKLPQVNEIAEKVNSAMETVKDAADKMQDIAESIQSVVDNTKETLEKNESEIKEEIEEEISETEEAIKKEAVEFYEVLDALAAVHPGTAGSSLKVASAAYKFLNNCKAKLPFDTIASEWIKGQDKSKYSDINESFTFVYDSLDEFKDSSAIKGILSDVGVELPDGTSFDGLIDEAKKVLKVVIDATK